MGSPGSSTIRVFAAVVRDDERYLICQRPLEKRYGGLWEFPGGKLEPSETMFEAARREMLEELGVEATEIGDSLLAIADPGSAFVIEFVPTKFRGTPVCLEHMALSWVPLANLGAFPLAPSDRRFVEYLLTTSAAASAD